LRCALSLFIRPEKKIVSIEDTAELNLPHENWNPMVERTGFGVRGSEAEIRMFELLKAALRQRPDVIIVGEVRGEEAYTMFQAMATGHGGLGSIHAESVKAVVDRLTSEPMNIPKPLIPTLHLIVLLVRMRVGERIYRKVIHIAEPYLDEKGEIRFNDVFVWDAYSRKYRYSGKSRTLERISILTGRSMEDIMDDIMRRKRIIEWMVKKNIRGFREVTEVIRNFYTNPEEVYQRANLELLSMEGESGGGEG
jgi:flagellar protein FlaI